MTYPRRYWLEIDPETGNPTDQVCWAYYGESDRPIEGYWILVEEIAVPLLDENQ